MSNRFQSKRALAVLAASAAAAIVGLSAGSASAYQSVQSFAQPEQRAGDGRILVEASVITVVNCTGPGERGGQYYIYAYQKRAGFRAILPPNWGSPIGGRDMASFDQAVGAACLGGGAVTPPGATRGTMSGSWGGYEMVQTGNRFTWHYGTEVGEGVINGDAVEASWTGGGHATGRITARNANGDPTRIEWSNGVVFRR